MPGKAHAELAGGLFWGRRPGSDFAAYGPSLATLAQLAPYPPPLAAIALCIVSGWPWKSVGVSLAMVENLRRHRLEFRPSVS